jgi:hypothetical protein
MLLSCLVLVHIPALFGPGGAPAARAAIIDNWQTAQQLATPPPTVGGVVSGPGIIGAFRASSLLGLGSDASSLSIGNGTLTFGVDAMAAHNVFLNVTWNGRPPGVGLGGVDVTDGGTATGFLLPVHEVRGGAIRYALVVADTSQIVGNVLGVIPDGARDLDLFLPFSEFIGQSQPVLVDMTRVDKVQLQLEVPPGARIVLGAIETPGAAAQVPEPAGVCLWAVAGIAAAAWLGLRPGS